MKFCKTSKLPDNSPTPVCKPRDNRNTSVTRRKRKLTDRDLCNSTEQISLDQCTLIVDYQKLVSCVATNGQLGDEHINTINQLLRSQLPDLEGLCTPVLGQQLYFPEYNIVRGYAGFLTFKQSNHWVTIETLT